MDTINLSLIVSIIHFLYFPIFGKIYLYWLVLEHGRLEGIDVRPIICSTAAACQYFFDVL